jgi:predicted Zn-dependent protease with MMP-like domain
MRRAVSAAGRARRLRFEKRVDKIMALLDPAVRKALDNCSIVVEEMPPEGRADEFGYYDGVPKSERGGNYTLVVPDRIVIYQRPLEVAFPDPRDLEDQIRITLLHEIGHHLGFDESGLDRIGLA